MENKSVSDKHTLKLFKQIEEGIKNLELYEKLYLNLGEEIFKLSNNSSLSEIGEYTVKHFQG